MCSTAVGTGPSAGGNGCTGRGGLGRGGACIRYDGRGIVTHRAQKTTGRTELGELGFTLPLIAASLFGPWNRAAPPVRHLI